MEGGRGPRKAEVVLGGMANRPLVKMHLEAGLAGTALGARLRRLAYL